MHDPNNVDEYFSTQPSPPEMAKLQSQVHDFIQYQLNNTSRPVVIVTSGGTTVPLEQNMVRFLDNFSAGTRGSASAEYFLAAGYAVIFLHRRFSLEPFSRHYSHATDCFLDFIDPAVDSAGNDIVRVKTDHVEELRTILDKYHKALSERRLLKVPFVTVTEYLWYLRMCAKEGAALGDRAMFYLAAAVSDFYIPVEDMAEHKIQSGDGPLVLRMQQVPKMLKPLVSSWCPHAFVVSFKLETDPKLLVPKARGALDKYGHTLVIGNILNTRKYHVKFVTKSLDENIDLDDRQIHDGVEIESIMIAKLVDLHKKWIADGH